VDYKMNNLIEFGEKCKVNHLIQFKSIQKLYD